MSQRLALFLWMILAAVSTFAANLAQEEQQKFASGLKFILSKPAAERVKYQRHFDLTASEPYRLLLKVQDHETFSPAPTVKITGQIGPIYAVLASRADLCALAADPVVEWIDISRNIPPCLDISRISTGATKLYSGNPSYRGKGVLVAIFDTGIDWRHADFIDEYGQSRILYLLDLTDDAGPHPAGLDYGSLYTQSQINDEIDGTPTGRVREKDIDGHGTHVAGIAAGNGRATGNGESAQTYIGMASLADLLIVKGGDEGFSTWNQVNGTAWVIEKAAELGRPVVMNFSLGGHYGAHDGTDLHEQAIDAAQAPGRAFVISAGNDGGDAMHASGYVPNGGSKTVSFTVQDDAEEIWINIWHEGSEKMSLTVTNPKGYTTPARRSGSQADWEAFDTDCGRMEIIAPGKNPNNNDYELGIYLDADGGTAVQPGEWSFTLKGDQTTIGRFDAWTQVWKAEFTSNIDYTRLVTMPGTAHGAITVASYCTKNTWDTESSGTIFYDPLPRLWDISDFSSPGPTRDGRLKPEITAPGHGISSALSADCDPSQNRIMPDGVHQLVQGTSQAAPHVTGGIALLLEKNPGLTLDEIRSAIINSGYTDNYTGEVWNAHWGAGKLEIDAAIDLIPGSISGTTTQHAVGTVNMGISDWGAVGNNCGAAPGFEFPSGSGQDHGFSGSFVAAASELDAADSYGTIEDIADDHWRTTENGRLRLSSPGIRSDQDSYAQFGKQLLTPDGLTQLQVTQFGYAWKNQPFVILDFFVTNQGPLRLENLLLGFLMDWDNQPDYETNQAGFDRNLNLAYVWDAGSTTGAYSGTVLLSHTTHSFDIIQNDAEIYAWNDLPDAEIYSKMASAGIMNSIPPGDLATLLNAAPQNLALGATIRFTVAFVAGSNLAQVRQVAATARQYFQNFNRSSYSLFYDDGSAEGGMFCTAPGEKVAVRFSPKKYPARVQSAQFYIRNAGADLKLNVHPAGTNGAPGSPLLANSIRIFPQANAWNSVDLTAQNLSISSGDFYISLEWITGSTPSLGYDEEFPHAQRSWSYEGTRWSNFTADGDPWDKRDLLIGVSLDQTTGISPAPDRLPDEYCLFPNFPNPFNPGTRLRYQLPTAAPVELKIYNLLGQQIRTLVQATQPAGIYEIEWDGHDAHGEVVSSGIYFGVLESRLGMLRQKLILMR